MFPYEYPTGLPDLLPPTLPPHPVPPNPSPSPNPAFPNQPKKWVTRTEQNFQNGFSFQGEKRGSPLQRGCRGLATNGPRYKRGGDPPPVSAPGTVARAPGRSVEAPGPAAARRPPRSGRRQLPPPPATARKPSAAAVGIAPPPPGSAEPSAAPSWPRAAGGCGAVARPEAGPRGGRGRRQATPVSIPLSRESRDSRVAPSESASCLSSAGGSVGGRRPRFPAEQLLHACPALARAARAQLDLCHPSCSRPRQRCGRLAGLRRPQKGHCNVREYSEGNLYAPRKGASCPF